MKNKKLITSLLLISVLFAGCALFKNKNKNGQSEQKIELTTTEKEKRHLNASIERRFENPDAHYELAKLYSQDGLWEKAQYEYNTVLSFEPLHRQAQAGLIKALNNTGQTEKARIIAEMYLSQTANSAKESLKLGRAFQIENMDEYSLKCYITALQLAPNSSAINKQIGYYHLSRNDNVRAQQYLTRSFQLNPYQPEVAGVLGRLGVVVQISQNKNTKHLDKILEEK